MTRPTFKRLAEAGGIHRVGVAAEGACGAEGTQSSEACHERADRLYDLSVHGSHPGAVRRGHVSDAALDRAVLLARSLLPCFA